MINTCNYVHFDTKYGLCKLRKDRYDAGDRRPIINRAIDKTEFIKAYLKDKFGELGYTFDKVAYKGCGEKLTITCPIHGDFDTLIGNFEAGKGHPKGRGEKISKNSSIGYCQYIDKIKKIHNNKYEYQSNDEKYKNSRSIINVYCQIHEWFKIRAIDHHNGNGCQKCGRISVQSKNKENPTGWTYNNWIDAANRSSRFDSYKVYFIECWDNETNETFFKIGRTFLSLKNRFVGKHNLPYAFNILYCIELPDPRRICELEKEYKDKHREFKYIPQKHFGGKNECFTKLIYI